MIEATNFKAIASDIVPALISIKENREAPVIPTFSAGSPNGAVSFGATFYGATFSETKIRLVLVFFSRLNNVFQNSTKY